MWTQANGISFGITLGYFLVGIAIYLVVTDYRKAPDVRIHHSSQSLREELQELKEKSRKKQSWLRAWFLYWKITNGKRNRCGCPKEK